MPALARTLTIIIVSHGHEADLPACVTSLPRAAAGLEADVLVVDNLGSGRLRTLLPRTGLPLRVLDNPAPLGLAANVNRAAVAARGDYLLVLNPDTGHCGGSLKEAVGFLDAHPEAAILGCRLVDEAGAPQESCRRFPTLPVLLLKGLGAGGWIRRPAFYRERMLEGRNPAEAGAVDWVFGAFMLLRRADLLALGGFDEGFRLYYEDADLCYRFRLRGRATWHFPSLVFYHGHQRASQRRPWSTHRAWHMRSAARFFLKHRYLWRPPAERLPPGGAA